MIVCSERLGRTGVEVDLHMKSREKLLCGVLLGHIKAIHCVPAVLHVQCSKLLSTLFTVVIKLSGYRSANASGCKTIHGNVHSALPEARRQARRDARGTHPANGHSSSTKCHKLALIGSHRYEVRVINKKVSVA